MCCYRSSAPKSTELDDSMQMLLLHPFSAPNPRHTNSITYEAMFHTYSHTTVQLGFGRFVHANQTGIPGYPALRLDQGRLSRDPRRLRPSLRPTRCLRRHQRYYASIRHPAAHRSHRSGLPCDPTPLPTKQRKRQGFSSSDDIRANMIRSPTPAVPVRSRQVDRTGVAFGY